MGFVGDPPGFMRLPKTRRVRRGLRADGGGDPGSGATDFIHVGIGGSALGPMALQKALDHLPSTAPHRSSPGGPRLALRREPPDPATPSAALSTSQTPRHLGKRRDQVRARHWRRWRTSCVNPRLAPSGLTRA